MLTFIIASSLIHLAVDIAAFWWGFNISGSLGKARTMVFLTACFYELTVVWNCRSERHNAFKVGCFNNKTLLVAFAISVVTTFAVALIPALQVGFKPFH
jgi:magnesium-transporting ATPase (P-type)